MTGKILLEPKEEIADAIDEAWDTHSADVLMNTSTLSFPIHEPGQVNVSAKITLTGCAAVTTPEVEVEVTKAPERGTWEILS